ETLAGVLASGLAGAVILPLLALLLSPLLELLFGYVTDIELLKLANFNHPLLKDLIVQAPGTYHHGILIGQLVEAAAREIGANPLLARVGAYYHDIGKGKNPLFFGENQKGENRLDGLTPQASAEIIRRHVASRRPRRRSCERWWTALSRPWWRRASSTSARSPCATWSRRRGALRSPWSGSCRAATRRRRACACWRRSSSRERSRGGRCS